MPDRAHRRAPLHPLVDPRGSFGGRGGGTPAAVPLLPSVGRGVRGWGDARRGRDSFTLCQPKEKNLPHQSFCFRFFLAL
jgi:hypothetical protein